MTTPTEPTYDMSKISERERPQRTGTFGDVDRAILEYIANPDPRILDRYNTIDRIMMVMISLKSHIANFHTLKDPNSDMSHIWHALDVAHNHVFRIRDNAQKKESQNDTELP